MFDRRELKSKAKIVLQRTYPNVFLACLIVSLLSGSGIGLNTTQLQNLNFTEMSNIRIVVICMIMGLLVLVGILFSIFLLSPLLVGFRRFLLNAAKGGGSLNDLLFPFKNNYKNITLTLFMKNLYIFLWSLPGYIPLIVAFTVFNLPQRLTMLITQIRQDSVSALLTLMLITTVLLVATIVFSIPSIIKDLQYSMVQYILADNPDEDWKTAIKNSKEMMVGNKWAYVKLMFSFLGWQLLANLVCCIGNFLIAPYIESTYAQMYIEVSGQRDEYQEQQFGGNDFFSSFGTF